MLANLRVWPRMCRSVHLLCAVLILLGVNLLLLFARQTITKPAECSAKAQPYETKLHQAKASTTAPLRILVNRTEVSGIPKILHYVFKSGQVFEAYKLYIKACLDQNPDWQVLFWSDAHSEKLIADHYGHFINKFHSYRDRLEKSDSVRYMILHKFGGIYLDMDVECRKPFSHLLNQSSVEESLIPSPVSSSGKPASSAFLGEERREQTRILYGYSYCTMNSMMGSRPGHPFFQLAIDRMLGMPMLTHARLTTGPDFLTGIYRLWLNCSSTSVACQANEPVTLYSARFVSPQMDTSLVNWESKCRPYFSKGKLFNRQKSDKWKAIGCSQLVASGWNFDQTDDRTVTVHRFLHLGYGNQGNRRTFNLVKEFPRIKTHYSP